MKNRNTISFASDNSAPVCPELMEALARVNSGATFGYGNDDHTRQMEERFKDLFQCDLRAFPVATGTAANVLALSVLTPPYGSVYCHRQAHIEMDECGAPEFYTNGAKLVLLDGEDGKIAPTDLVAALSASGAGVVHHVQPAALSLTQVTECGTLYTPDEIASLTDIARSHGLSVHMDGARFANAAAAMGVSPADLTWRSGVDVLSFGATKNGAMAVEAVVFFNPEEQAARIKDFEFRRKRGAHLFSKMRYLSAQLDRHLEGDLWLRLAGNANAMAARLKDGLSSCPDVALLYPVEANILFARLPEATIDRLETEGFLFYVMGARQNGQVRLVTSWNTTADEVDAFLSIVRQTGA
ncbi:threonine aldolase family protein [Sneathiella chinensis]|uniref:L-threonine aldolase n=1 Tax=Sneathiella chinensis TaxID=349750 RepID=A0ABQ5U3X2_9PROT|nr:low specificity L-threonine aldolase [Sneathiella chinensis]GLQ06365.1 L-threonine aldolase [Sneathiella chinensis]